MRECTLDSEGELRVMMVTRTKSAVRRRRGRTMVNLVREDHFYGRTILTTQKFQLFAKAQIPDMDQLSSNSEGPRRMAKT
jgi:hypothetical protein